MGIMEVQQKSSFKERLPLSKNSFQKNKLNTAFLSLGVLPFGPTFNILVPLINLLLIERFKK